jgi:hypothetical protein
VHFSLIWVPFTVKIMGKEAEKSKSPSIGKEGRLTVDNSVFREIAAEINFRYLTSFVSILVS